MTAERLFDLLGNPFCPICQTRVKGSEHLSEAITDEKVRFIANMVTHYRHTHISSWNKCWGPKGGYYRAKWFKGYDEEKKIVNERAKRQILRKCTAFLKLHKIDASHFGKLENIEEKTLRLAIKLLGGKPGVDFPVADGGKQLNLF